MKISKEAFRAKLIGEMEELAIVAGYLFIVFATSAPVQIVPGVLDRTMTEPVLDRPRVSRPLA
jgi:hypothetical protein